MRDEKSLIVNSVLCTLCYKVHSQRNRKVPKTFCLGARGTFSDTMREVKEEMETRSPARQTAAASRIRVAEMPPLEVETWLVTLTHTARHGCWSETERTEGGKRRRHGTDETRRAGKKGRWEQSK